MPKTALVWVKCVNLVTAFDIADSLLISAFHSWKEESIELTVGLECGRL
jgi:hypothetical protein